MDCCDEGVYKQYGKVYSGFLQKHYRNLYLEGIWLNDGDWDAALRELEFTPERMRLRAYWEVERVLTKIRFLREKGPPLYPAYVIKHYAALFSAALRILGLGVTHYFALVSKFLTLCMVVGSAF